MRIDDGHSCLSKYRPFVYLIEVDGSKAVVAPVDVLRSIEAEPTTINHPVIVHVLEYWTNLIKGKRYIRESGQLRGSLRVEVNDISIGQPIKRAEKNLA